MRQAFLQADQIRLCCRAGTAELEDQGAATDAAADPLAAASEDDSAPLAPSFEPDGMAQLASVDTDAEAGSGGTAAMQSVDALSATDPTDGLTQAAAGDSSFVVLHKSVGCGQYRRRPDVHEGHVCPAAVLLTGV